MTPEIRKLQMLNDLVTQTLEALNQRVASGGQQFLPGGFAQNPFGAVNPYGASNPYATGGINPYAGQVPFANQLANPYGWGAQAGVGLSHSPFVQQGMGMIPNQGVFPQVGSFGNPYGFGAPIVGQANSGLSHTPYGVQSGNGGVGGGQGYLDPRLIDPRLNQLNQLNQFGQASRFGATNPYGAIW
jgi:hypothetical protein